jgi:hypothetical protein
MPGPGCPLFGMGPPIYPLGEYSQANKGVPGQRFFFGRRQPQTFSILAFAVGGVPGGPGLPLLPEPLVPDSERAYTNNHPMV